MVARSPQNSESFARVTDLMLRRVLASGPRQVKAAEMRKAVACTLNAVTRDLLDDDPALNAVIVERKG
jgi:hypothetical protein